MAKKNLDWANIGFAYHVADKRFVSNYKDGKWDDGVITEDATITLSEDAGVLHYAQECFEGLKAYETEDGRIVTFRPRKTWAGARTATPTCWLWASRSGTACTIPSSAQSAAQAARCGLIPCSATRKKM